MLGYTYGPFEEIPKYAARFRFVLVPVMLLSGFLDMERPCPPTTYFEDIGLTSHSSRPANAGGLTPMLGPVYRVAQRKHLRIAAI